MDIKDLQDDDLLGGLELTQDRERNSGEIWLESEGYYPGQTKVAAGDLWRKYAEWLTCHPEAGRRLNHKSLGLLLATRFKKGRSRTGYFYYLSKIPTERVCLY